MAGNTAGNTKEFFQVNLEYFRMNAKNIIEKMSYLDFSSDVWELFCYTEGTRYYSQKELFEFSVKWAKQRCRDNNLEDTPEQLRSLLSEVLKKLRFAEMSTKEFMDYVLPTFILNNEEVGKVIADRRKMAEDTKVEVWIKWHYYEPKAFKVQLSTKIVGLKKLDFKKRYSNEPHIHEFFTCTLSHKDKVLSDDTCLESIYTPGEQLVLEVHSATYNVKVLGTEIAFPITIEGKKCSETEKIVKSHLHCFHDIHPDDVAYVEISRSGLQWVKNYTLDVKLLDYPPLWRHFRELDTFLGITSLFTLISILVILAVIHPKACSMVLCTVGFFKIGYLLFQHQEYIYNYI